MAGGSVAEIWRRKNGALAVGYATKMEDSLSRAASKVFHARYGRSYGEVLADHEKYLQGIKAELIEEALTDCEALPISLIMSDEELAYE